MRYLKITSMLAVAAAAPAIASDVGDSFERQQTARDMISHAGASYLDNSLDKTIVMRCGHAHKEPAPQGQGVGQISCHATSPGRGGSLIAAVAGAAVW